MNYLRELLMKQIETKDFLPIQMCPSKYVELSVKFDRPIHLAMDDPDFHNGVDILSYSTNTVIQKYKNWFDFFEPQLIIKPDGTIISKIAMRPKPKEENE